APGVDLSVLLDGLRLGLRVAGRGEGLLRGLEFLLPGRVLLLEFLVAQALGRGNEGDAVPHDEVEFAVTVHVSDPYPGRMRGAGEVALAEGLAVLDRGSRFDQGSERLEVGQFALAGLVPRPVDAAIARPAHQVQSPVAVQVDDERVAVRALDSQW